MPKRWNEQDFDHFFLPWYGDVRGCYGNVAMSVVAYHVLSDPLAFVESLWVPIDLQVNM